MYQAGHSISELKFFLKNLFYFLVTKSFTKIKFTDERLVNKSWQSSKLEGSKGLSNIEK